MSYSNNEPTAIVPNIILEDMNQTASASAAGVIETMTDQETSAIVSRVFEAIREKEHSSVEIVTQKKEQSVIEGVPSHENSAIETTIVQEQLNVEIVSDEKQPDDTTVQGKCNDKAVSEKKKPDKKRMEYFPLMELPIVVRLMIWKLLVVLNGPIKVERRKRIVSLKDPLPYLRSKSEHRCRKCYERKPTILEPAFTCRQIFQEASLVYYSQNTFQFPVVYRRTYIYSQDPLASTWKSTASDFADAIGDRNFRLINKVSVDLSGCVVRDRSTGIDYHPRGRKGAIRRVYRHELLLTLFTLRRVFLAGVSVDFHVDNANVTAYLKQRRELGLDSDVHDVPGAWARSMVMRARNRGYKI